MGRRLAIAAALLLSAHVATAANETTRAQEQIRFAEDSARLRDSCSDVTELENIGRTMTTPEVVALYANEARSRRATKIDGLKRAVQDLLEKGRTLWTADYFAAGDTADGAREDLVQETPSQAIAKVRARLNDARCYDEATVAKLLTIVDSFESGPIASRVAAERKCRSTPSCMASRFASVACSLLAARRADLSAIEEERRNPGGVVDLAKLHGLGQEVQMLDGQIAAAKKQFAAAAKKPFSEAVCSTPPPQPRP